MTEKISILIVDDDHVLGANLKELLSGCGYRPTCTLSGTEALRLVKKEDFQLVLTDYKMPEMNGFEVIKSIKMIKQELPVILMTASDEPFIKREALKLGAFDCIFKPFNSFTLLRVLQKGLIKRKRNEDNTIKKYQADNK